MLKTSSPHTECNRARARTAWLIALTVVAVAPYLFTLGWPFALDDWPLIVHDSISHSLSRIPDVVMSDFLRGNLGDTQPFYYRPLVTISFQLNYAMAGPNPSVFHATNVLLNLVVVMLVFAIARRVSRNDFAGGMAAVAYALLPSHAESVAWISGRTDVMSTMFILASLLVFMVGHERRPAFSRPLAALFSVTFACALLSKESGLATPLVIAAYVWIFGDSASKRQALKWAAVLLPVIVAYAILRNHVIGASLQEHLLVRINERLMSVGIAYAAYLRMLFLPQELRVIYDVFPMGIRYPALAAAAWLLPVGLVGLGVWARKRAPVLAFGSLWIFLTLLPVSNILPTVGPMPAERFVYLASVGSSIIIGWVIRKACEWRPKSVRIWPVLAKVLIVWLVLYTGALTVRSSRYYESDVAWSRAIAASNTRFAIIRATAGGYFLAAGLLEEAAAEYDATFELAKKHELIIEDYINAAVVRRRLNDIGKSIDLLLAARRKFGDLPQIEYHLGIAYAEGGELENAAGAFRRATELKPDLDIAWRNLGRAQLELGRYGEAVAAYERAFATLEPSLKERLDLGRAYKGAGDTARARREYEVVMESDPEGKMGKRASAEIARLDSQSK